MYNIYQFNTRFNKYELMSDSVSELTEPHTTFISYYSMLKTIANLIKIKLGNSTYSNEFIEHFTYNGQYINFLSVIGALSCLNEVYDTDFNLSKVGIEGMEILIYGIYFIYYKVKLDFNYDADEKILEKTRNFIDDLIKNWIKLRKIKFDSVIKQKQIYEQKVIQYISSTKQN